MCDYNEKWMELNSSSLKKSLMNHRHHCANRCCRVGADWQDFVCIRHYCEGLFVFGWQFQLEFHEGSNLSVGPANECHFFAHHVMVVCMSEGLAGISHGSSCLCKARLTRSKF